MCGEWCTDWYDSGPNDSQKDSYRVVRGGCWGHASKDCQSAERNGLWPSGRARNLGFRPCFSLL